MDEPSGKKKIFTEDLDYLTGQYHLTREEAAELLSFWSVDEYEEVAGVYDRFAVAYSKTLGADLNGKTIKAAYDTSTMTIDGEGNVLVNVEKIPASQIISNRNIIFPREFGRHLINLKLKPDYKPAKSISIQEKPVAVRKENKQK